MLHKKNQKKLDQLSLGLGNRCPEFASILLYAPRIAVAGDFITRTDGKIIKVGEKFFTLPFEKQVYKMLHMALHVGLRHHHRAYELAGNPIALNIWEVSTDIIINESIKGYVEEITSVISSSSKLSFDNEKDIITLKKLQEPLEKLGFDINDTENLRAENIFSVLVKGVQKLEINITELPLPDESEQDLEGNQFDISESVLKANGLEEELNDSNKSSVSDMLWSNRVRKAFQQAGKFKGSSVIGLLEHLYKPKVNWQAILRSFLTSRLRPDKESDYSRPSRRNLAGVTKIFEPNRVRKKGIKTLVVCLDTSGSCWNSEVVSKFVSNIDVIHQSTGSELVLISFDDGVQGVFEVKANEKISDMINSKRIEITGGGGTSFVEPIEKALEYNPDVIAVFTDCYGPFGDQPKGTPVLWATIGDEAPWGRNILIEEN